MKIKAITYSTREDEGLNNLLQSCKQFNIDIEVLQGKWRGFGTKILETRDYVKTLEGYTHFLFVDAYDTLFVSGLEEVNVKANSGHLIVSVEKACWPDSSLASKYPHVDTPWKYINSGSYLAPIDLFLEIVEENPIDYRDDDQLWLTKVYLTNKYVIELDYSCKLFQSLAFEADTDFTYTHNRLLNNVTNNFPIVLHGNGKTPMKKVNNMPVLNSVKDLKEAWKDKENIHKWIHESCTEKVINTSFLNDHRDWVANHMFGFGEKSFHWMWKCLVDAMPTDFSFLEVGVFRGQVLSLIELLASYTQRKSRRWGVTPLSPIGIGWESDYGKDIELLHDTFNIPKDYSIIQYNSTDPKAIEEASKRMYDIVFIDGGHDYETVKSDLKHYTPLVKEGGYLVIDDSACKFHMPFGYFQGIAEVCKAVDEVLPNTQFEELFCVVHNRVFKKITS